MLGKILIIGFIFSNLILIACNPAISQNGQSQTEKNTSLQSAQPTQNETSKVNFKGVTFNYNPQVFSEIKPEEIAETPMQDETDKPGGEYPRHISFILKVANQKMEGKLKIIPIEDYRRMYAISKNYTKVFDEELADLRKFLKNKNFRRNHEIPFIPFYDAHQAFQAKVENLSFQSGRGFFFLTQYDQESFDPVTNENLTYIYQGISDDGRNYILAEFPTSVSFLPTSYDNVEPETAKLLTRWTTDGDSKGYEQYVMKIKKRLNDLPRDEFQPSLKHFEEIITSLKIENN